MKCLIKYLSLILLVFIKYGAVSNQLSSKTKIDPLSSILDSGKSLNINASNEDDTNQEYDEYFDFLNNSASNSVKKIVTSRQFYQLRRKLLRYYDPNSRPIYDSSKTIDVGLSVIVLQINDLDAAFQVKNLFLFFKLQCFFRF
jgi:hypothetical protein